jgi:hypothetical protein
LLTLALRILPLLILPVHPAYLLCLCPPCLCSSCLCSLPLSPASILGLSFAPALLSSSCSPPRGRRCFCVRLHGPARGL